MQASIAFAESTALALDLRFTDPLSPLFIDVGDDTFDALFVISTSQVHGVGRGASQVQGSQPQAVNGNERKRGREEEREAPDVRVQDHGKRPADRRKPMKVVQRTDVAGYQKTTDSSSSTSQPGGGLMPSPPSIPRQRSSLLDEHEPGPSSLRRDASEPLFLPPSSLPRQQSPLFSQPVGLEPLFLPGSQLSQAAEQAIRDSGLGIENMNTAEFEAMLEGDEEEMELLGSQVPRKVSAGSGDRETNGKDENESERESDDDSLSLWEDVEMLPTQEKSHGGDKSFRPLFED